MKLLRTFFKANGDVQPVYIYVFILFIFLFLFFGVRLAAVFCFLPGDLLSDELMLGIAGLIVGLLVNFNWAKKKKEDK